MSCRFLGVFAVAASSAGFLLFSSGIAICAEAAGHSIAERAQQREQALALLDDPDHVVRLSALEEILADSDNLLKQLAVKKVFAGTDTDLKNMAVSNAFAQQDRQHSFVIAGCSDDTRGTTCRSAEQTSNGVIPLYFHDFNVGSGQFQAFSTFSSGYPNRVTAMAGRLVDGTAVFQFSANNLGYISCSAHMQLTKAGRFEGTIGCGATIMSGSFDIQ